MDDLKNGKLVRYVQIIGILAVIVLIMIAIVAGFTKVVRTDTTVRVDGITLAAVNVSTGLGTSYPYVQSITGCVNATDSNALTAAEYTVTEGDTGGGSLTLNDAGSEWATEDVNCTSVRYLADSDGQAVGDKFTTGMAIFATFVGVLVLAIIGLVIVGLYKKQDED